MTDKSQAVSLGKLIRRGFSLVDTLQAVAFATYKEWTAYRSHVLVSLFVGPVYFLTQVFIWTAVFTNRETINGLTLEQMLLYYGVATVIHYLTYDSAGWNIQMLIHSGRFLTFMLRPMSHRFFALSQKVGHRMLGLMLEFIPVYLMFWFLFKIRLVPVYPFWSLLSVGLSFVMIFLINYTIGLSAFWLTRTGGVRQMFAIMRDLFAGVFIPLSFFPEIFQKIFFILPFQFCTYVPIRVFLGSYELAGISLTIPQIVAVQALAVLGMLGISEIVWRLGIKRFTGVGA
jgi:ABC-2 type transport system permease protein